MDMDYFLTLLDELFEVAPGTVTAESVLEDIPGWCSLVQVGLITLIDSEFGLTWSLRTILSHRTAADLFDRIMAMLGQDAAVLCS